MKDERGWVGMSRAWQCMGRWKEEAVEAVEEVEEEGG
jgi:hypothetical protein